MRSRRRAGGRTPGVWGTVGPGPGADRPARDLAVAGALVSVALALVAVAASSVFDLQASSSRSWRAEVALQDASHQIDGLRFAPTGALLSPPGSPVPFALEHAMHLRAAGAVRSLSALSPLGRSLAASEAGLDSAMRSELDLVAAGRVRAARSYDTDVVDPIYLRAVHQVGGDDAALLARARRAEEEANSGVVYIVLATTGLLCLLLGGVGLHARSRSRIRLQEVVASEERFRALVHNSSDMITVVDDSATVLYQAPSVLAVLGRPAETLEGRPLWDLVHPDDLGRLRAAVLDVSHRSQEARLLHADGGWRVCELRWSRLRGADPAIGRTVFNTRDVTERVELEEVLRHQALHDSLTGLCNRLLFADRLEHALLGQARTGEAVAVVIVDLDDFKGVNDTLGHPAGDAMLVEAAGRLRKAFRSADTVARLGGDEFAVLLRDPADCLAPDAAAERILEAFRRPMTVGGQELLVTASVGVAVAPEPGTSADALVRDADVAMYEAKKAGKNHWARFEPEMHTAVEGWLRTKTELSEAVAAGDQMRLHYQPIVDLDTGAVAGFEALVRWMHPTRGLVPPAGFLPVAEETGLVVPLGTWVLGQACAQAAAWRDHPAFPPGMVMSVNVSGRQLDAGLVAAVEGALAASGLDPRALLVEVTENAAVAGEADAEAVLAALRSIGVRIAIDDFGTGLSSLEYLARLPVDVLKVDRLFTVGLSCEPRTASLAEAVVGLGSTLGLPTIAEGVETEEQRDLLAGLGCGYAQGHLFSEALPADALEAFVLSGTVAASGAAAP